MAIFLHHDLKLLNPRFDSPLVDVLTDLEHLRRLQLQITTPELVFKQLKDVFHYLESLSSARIEGNHTTLADYVETKVHPTDAQGQSEQITELTNIEQAMSQVEQSVQAGDPIPENLLRGLHHTVVQDLQREGDAHPGEYRAGPVQIAAAEHLPPEALAVPGYMADLAAFINQQDPPKYDLIKVALAHHRFAWIHPFGNGNGRVVRLLTHAMLIKYGFQVNAAGRLLNPAAVFCADRDAYYAHLAAADTGTPEALEAWCLYVLTGIRDELKRVTRLTDYDHLQRVVLLPMVTHAQGRQLINAQEAAILRATIAAGIVKSSALEQAMPGSSGVQRTYRIRQLVASGMLQPIAPGARQYTVGFNNNTLLRGVIHALTAEGFISAALAQAPGARH